jgi:hypothetical protein
VGHVKWDAYVLAVVRGAAAPVRLREIAHRVRDRLRDEGAQDVIDAERNGHYDDSIYDECGAATQRLKQAGKIALKRGRGSGWYPL